MKQTIKSTIKLDGRVKKRGWKLQDWTMTDEFAGVDIAGLDIDVSTT